MEVDGKTQLVISMREFCKSNMIYLPLNKVNKYLERIKDISADNAEYVTLNQYITWQYFLRNIDHLLEQVKEYKYLDLKKFKIMVKHFEKEFY